MEAWKFDSRSTFKPHPLLLYWILKSQHCEFHGILNIIHNTYFLDWLIFYCAQAEDYVLIPDCKTLSYLSSNAFLLSVSLILQKTHSILENRWAM